MQQFSDRVKNILSQAAEGLRDTVSSNDKKKIIFILIRKIIFLHDENSNLGLYFIVRYLKLFLLYAVACDFLNINPFVLN